MLSEGDNSVERYQQDFDLGMEMNLKPNDKSRDRYNNVIVTTEPMKEAEEID